jgi:hypothetical protein
MNPRLRNAAARLVPVSSKPVLLKMYFGWRLWWKPTIANFGLRVVCPCCGGRFSRFRSVTGEDGAVNQRCPRCTCSERHRLLWLFLKHRTRLFDERHAVLHFAPENILHWNLSRLEHVQYVTTDLLSMGTTVQADITAIPFAPHSFDAVICSHVLEHVPDDRRGMEEILRVLRPGGWAILQVPFDRDRADTFEDPSVTSPEERRRVFGQSDHVRIYGRDYVRRLRAAGFDVTVSDYAATLPPATIRRYGLLAEEEIFFCRKPAGAAAALVPVA